jgi:acyl carrier protein
MADQDAEVRGRVRELLTGILSGDRLLRDTPDDVSLRAAGVSSTALVSLLVAMEDAFGFEWEDDVRPEVLRSIDSLAGHVVALRG